MEEFDDKAIKKLNKKSTNEVENSKISNFIYSIENLAELNFYDSKLMAEKKKNKDPNNVVKWTIEILKVIIQLSFM